MFGLRSLVLLPVLVLIALPSHAQCSADYRNDRNDKKPGIQIIDLAITGTQTLTSDQIAEMTSGFIEACFNDDSDEIESRVRAAFQEHGYYAAQVKSFTFKAHDPIAVPKPVSAEAEVVEGPIYKIADISFLNNRAFTSDVLRQHLPVKNGEVFTRSRIASGFGAIRKLYGSAGYLDTIFRVGDVPTSDATVQLTLTFDEGRQYHLNNIEIAAEKSLAAKLLAEWKLQEGAVYDAGYIDEFLDANRNLLPESFSRETVKVRQNCPEAQVDVRLIVDPSQDSTKTDLRNIPCESDKEDESK
jgi:outer membrane protein assembly factor BamA